MTKLSDIILPIESYAPEWIDMPGLGPDVRFHLRPINAPEYQRAFKVQFRVLALELRKKWGDDEVSDRRKEVESQSASIEAELLAASEALIVGWSGLEDDDGSDLPYSPSVAYRILSHEEAALDDVLTQSRTLAESRQEARDRAEGNSASSPGASSGVPCDPGTGSTISTEPKTVPTA
jgi:hypothetical protein